MKKLLVLAALGFAAFGQSQIIWDNTGLQNGTTFRGAGDEPALQITNTNAVAINLTGVAFSGQNNATQDINFFLADSAGNILAQTVVGENATGAHALIGTSVNWTLAAGGTYFIGAATSTVGDNYDYEFPSFHLQNGLQSAANGNFSGFNNPSFNGTAGADMAWQLKGQAVPEPCTIAIFGLGLAGVIRRRRKSA